MIILLHITTLGISLDLQIPYNPLASQAGRGLSFLYITYIKLAYFYLISHAILWTSIHDKKFLRCSTVKHCKRSTRCLEFILLGLLLLNFLLIGICNPSLLNPGPPSLRVSYQNVQGLIPLSKLSSPHPTLDQTKIFELNAYIHKAKPDVIMLNETWLKKSIKDHEVIENPNYNVYRNDRSQLTHPADPSNPSKFKKFGGGVLVAIRSDLDATFKRLSMRK